MTSATVSTHTLRFQTDVNQLRRAMNQADKELADIAVQFDRAAASARNLRVATENTAKSMNTVGKQSRNSRFMMFQFGQQVQDLAIVSQFGDRAIGQMGIQIGQLASIISTGVIGQLIGVASVVGGIFLQNFLKSKDAVSSLAEEFKELVKETEALAEANDLLAAGYQNNARGLAQLKYDQLLAEITPLREEFEKLSAAVADDKLLSPSAQLRFSQLTDLMPDLEKGLAAASEALDKFNQETIEHAELSAGAFGEEARQRAINYYRVHMQGAARAAEELERLQIIQNREAAAAWRRGEVGPDAARYGVMDNNIAGQGFDPETGLYGVIDTFSTYEEVVDKAAKATRKLDKETKKVLSNYEIWIEDLGEIGDLIDSQLTRGVDGFIDAITDADASFSEFARNFLRDIAKMIARQILLNSLQTSLGGVFGFAAPESSPIPMPRPRLAKGGVVGAEMVYRGATIGEAGPEAVIPLRRGADGAMGVASSPVNVYNYAGAEVQVERNADRTDIIISQARSAVASDFARSMQTGQGPYARALEGGYRTSRRTG